MGGLERSEAFIEVIRLVSFDGHFDGEAGCVADLRTRTNQPLNFHLVSPGWNDVGFVGCKFVG